MTTAAPPASETSRTAAMLIPRPGSSSGLGCSEASETSESASSTTHVTYALPMLVSAISAPAMREASTAPGNPPP